MHSFGLVCRPSIRNPPHLFVEEMVKFSKIQTVEHQFRYYETFEGFYLCCWIQMVILDSIGIGNPFQRPVFLSLF